MVERAVRAHGASGVCAITGKAIEGNEGVYLGEINPKVAERIRKDHPEIDDHALILRSIAGRYRTDYVEELLTQESGELTKLDRAVAKSLADGELVSTNIEDSFEQRRTFGEMLSDHLAQFGGSWMFLSCFGVFLLIWMAYNALSGPGIFDPYPFILLNLLLSCLASVQAPIILMSQRRQETKDRLRSQSDYQVNLKAELEIRHLHEKIDHLMSNQWRRLAEIQELQIELLQERR